MRGLLIVGLLIVTLIIGILVMKNIESGPEPGKRKTEAINQAREAAKASRDVAGKIKDIAGKPVTAVPDTP